MEISEYQVLLKDIITDTSYSGILFKDGRTYKGEGDLRGGGGDPGGLPGYGGAVLQGDMSLAFASVSYKPNPASLSPPPGRFHPKGGNTTSFDLKAHQRSYFAPHQNNSSE